MHGPNIKNNATDDETVKSSALHPEPDPRLVAALGPEISLEDLTNWAVMPEYRRMTALKRIEVLDRYWAEGNGFAGPQAAAELGITDGRFYQMARIWREKRSLGGLGTYGLVTKQRAGLKPHQKSALLAVVRQVVEAGADRGDSIAAMARELGQASKLAADDVPSKNTLRVFIENERRRLRDNQLAGTVVLFDLSATSLCRSDGLPHVVFLVIDDGTGLILGHAIGLAEESAAGFRAAASVSLSHIATVLHRRNIWSQRMERFSIVPGADASDIYEISSTITAQMSDVSPVVTAQGAQGRYIRHHLGLRLGSVRLLPSRTITSGTLANDTKGLELDTANAFARVGAAVAEYNATLLAGLELDGDAAPPGELLRILETMATV